MVNTSVRLGNIELENPVIPASGTFAFGYEFADFYDINMLGAVVIKGLTRDERLHTHTKDPLFFTGILGGKVGNDI